jgi:hypothetical protein
MVIHRWMTRLFKNQWLKVPSGLIMFGYFFVAILFRSSSLGFGPYTLPSPASARRTVLPCDGGRYVSGCGMTFCFVLAAAARRRSNSALSWRGEDTQRTAVVGSSDCVKREGRSRGWRGSRKRGIECSEAMVGGACVGASERRQGVRIGGCGGPTGSGR